jgi:hypothetical protein
MKVNQKSKSQILLNEIINCMLSDIDFTFNDGTWSYSFSDLWYFGNNSKRMEEKLLKIIDKYFKEKKYEHKD